MSGSLLEEPPTGQERGASPLPKAVEHLRPHELFMRFAWGSGQCFRCTSDERPVTPVIEIVWAGITALESLCPPCLFRAWVTVEYRRTGTAPPLRVRARR